MTYLDVKRIFSEDHPAASMKKLGTLTYSSDTKEISNNLYPIIISLEIHDYPLESEKMKSLSKLIKMVDGISSPYANFTERYVKPALEEIQKVVKGDTGELDIVDIIQPIFFSNSIISDLVQKRLFNPVKGSTFHKYLKPLDKSLHHYFMGEYGMANSTIKNWMEVNGDVEHILAKSFDDIFPAVHHNFNKMWIGTGINRSIKNKELEWKVGTYEHHDCSSHFKSILLGEMYYNSLKDSAPGKKISEKYIDGFMQNGELKITNKKWVEYNTTTNNNLIRYWEELFTGFLSTKNLKVITK